MNPRCLWAAVILGASVGVRAGLVDGICVVVNDSVITYDQVERVVYQLEEPLATRYASQPRTFEDEVRKLRASVIENLVQQKLIVHEFDTTGYNLPESFIDDAIQDRIRKEYLNDRVRWRKELEAKGQSVEEYRQEQRESIIVDYMRGQHVSLKKILISPAKIEAYYKEHTEEFKLPDQVKLRMIVVPQPADGEPGQAKRMTQEILTKIEGGVPFAEMAAVNSSGSYRAEGGDRGWVDRTYLKPALADIAFSLKAGQRSGVIEQPEGCYLILVEDARVAHVKPLSDARAEIEQTLRNKEGDRLLTTWIDRLKEKSFVSYYQ